MFPIMAGNSASTGYNLTRSLRFRASAGGHLSKTFAAASDQKTFTISNWLKRGRLAIDATFFASVTDANNFLLIYYQASTDKIIILGYSGGSAVINISTSAVFRDPSAWYHVVIAFDTTQATGSNRVKLYINNTQQTLTFTTTPSLNLNALPSTTRYIGRAETAANYFDGYLTEVNFIDGQALTPSSFGSTNTLTGVWQPARYTGTYGTNGFYLPFTDNSALTTSSNAGLGKDFSGNGNYWTTNNISITAGTTYDSMTDVPTLTSATAANYCVLNPLSNGAGTLSAGNLNHVVGGSITRCNSTIFASSGKWYFEVTLNTAGTNTSIGIGQNNITNQYPGQDILSFVQEIDNARKGNNDVYTSYGTALTAGQVFMCAVDLTNLKIFFGGQGSWFASSDPVAGTNPAFTLTAGLYCAISRPFGGSAAISINFGQRPFTYTPPTGFVALNTYNLPTSTIVKGNTVFDATLYTGNASTNTIVNAGAFKPDLVWPKSRSAVYNHTIYDSVRGATKTLFPNLTNAEVTEATTLTSFNTNGFTLGSEARSNDNGTTYVAWQWQAGQGSSSSNTNGTITSTVSVNASAGFSIVTYTGTGANATVGHGLGVALQFIIVKNRSNTTDWQCYHVSLGKDFVVQLNLALAKESLSNYWYNGVTSSVFGINGSYSGINANGATYVAYCWTPIAGYSAFGSYTGNGSADGTFVYTGFKPRWVLIKHTTVANNWILIDSARNEYNLAGSRLMPNASDAEANDNGLDILSNGFKLRSTNGATNTSGGVYIYAAFASNPFRNSLAQ